MTQVRGSYKERRYTGACDREGVAPFEDRPVGGKPLFIRIAGESPAPALAEATTRPDGTFEMSFHPPVAGDYCIAHHGKERLVCLTSFRATPIEGSIWTQVVLGPLGARPQCGSQLRGVHGQTLFLEEPCGDSGKPPHPLGGKRVWIHNLDVREVDVGVDSDASGSFSARLLPGHYCVRLLLRNAPPGQPVADGCVTTFDVAGQDIGDLAVHFKRTCGAANPLRPGQEPLPAQARGLGRVRALGGTIHVRGQVNHQTTYWGGAYRRDPPPVVSAGNVLRIRRGNKNGLYPLVAEVTTDEYGFDVALPAGDWCFETAYHDDSFKGWASAKKNDFDGACMRRHYETCDFVAYVRDQDIEDIRISTTQWNPPSLPCRLHPYNGSAPP
jgi:hypothetical protein